MLRKSGLFLAAVLFGLLMATPAGAAVGIEKTSRLAGAPGAQVRLTLGCGFCYPPCKGPRGHREPSPCMLGTKARPPASFGISLVPVEQAPWPHRCGPRAFCSPQVAGPPRRSPFRYLGEAAALNDVTQETGRVPVPRYVLDFTIPDLRPGTYTYLIYCAVCGEGKGGSLIGGSLDADSLPRLWRLEVRAPGGGATIGR
jgi:hypothetical protein